MSTDHYAGSFTTDDVERGRVDLLCQIYDPMTIRHITGLCIQPSWHCLEVGAGTGSIANWLAHQVRGEGRVVATDINLRFLADQMPSNVELRRNDIQNDPLEESAFDLVHCRMVLMHLARPMNALARMRAALRPGGWLLVEESDYSSFGAADPSHPDAAQFDQLTHRILRAVESVGLADLAFGRRVPALLDRLALSSRDNEGVTWIWHGGQAGALYHHTNFCRLVRPKTQAVAGMTEVDYQTLGRLFADPAFTLVDRTCFAAWGCCP